jgi:hypothetical protein
MICRSTQGGSEPQWRADGRELFYLAANRRLTAVAVTTIPGLSVGRPMKLFDTIVDTSVGSIHGGATRRPWTANASSSACLRSTGRPRRSS